MARPSEKEGPRGQIQAVNFDPPYGFRYGSNFQPLVNRREITDYREDERGVESLKIVELG